jgi:uncharacterized protein YbjT (DUF2867 family)
VAGAGGFVGRRLIGRLVADGFDVTALVRRSTSIDPRPGVEVATTDVADTDALVDALRGCDLAYYLVHSMAGGEGFPERDRALARSFAEASRRAGVGRIVYLGGLGHGELSEHLASRHETGDVLGSTGIPVVELRAAVVLGAGSISFEMVRYLTERLPMMVCPRWVNTRVQPIAEADLLAYLVEAADVEPGTYEVGCPDVTTYRRMMDDYARVRGLRPRFIVKVPLLSPQLSAHWVDLVTPVDAVVSHALIGSLANEVVVRDRERTDAAFSVRPLASAEAIRAALDRQAERVPAGLFARPQGLLDGIHTSRSFARVRARSVGTGGEVAGVRVDLDNAGGELGWYGVPRLWGLRLTMGRLFGEDLRLERPDRVEVGARVDWWDVEVRDGRTLVLGTTSWFCGEAWLGYRVVGALPTRIEQVGALRTRGLVGQVYWWLLWPIHQVVFRAMVHHRVRSARRLARRVGPGAVLPAEEHPGL